MDAIFQRMFINLLCSTGCKAEATFINRNEVLVLQWDAIDAEAALNPRVMDYALSSGGASSEIGWFNISNASAASSSST